MAKMSFQYVRQSDPESLIQFLVRRFRYHTEDEWRSLVKKGFVKVNGKKSYPGQMLETRHKIVYERPPLPEPEVDDRFAILYEDSHLIAVDKSGNIPTSPSGKYWHHCLVHVVQKRLGLESLHAVHRLDRETSGVNLFAKSSQVAGLLGKVFQQGTPRKEYTMILSGRLAAHEIYVSAPLRGMPHGQIRIKQEVHEAGKDSRTRFQLQARLPGASLVLSRPITGRTHQIRAHAAFLGHPVVGDKLYGRSEGEFLKWVTAPERDFGDRQLLHANALSLEHPITGKMLNIRSSAKELMQRYLGNWK